jgi:hypothetical protein
MRTEAEIRADIAQVEEQRDNWLKGMGAVFLRCYTDLVELDRELAKKHDRSPHIDVLACLLHDGTNRKIPYDYEEKRLRELRQELRKVRADVAQR